MTAAYVAAPPMQQWTCGDTLTELRGSQPRMLPTRPAKTGTELTWSDFLAGAGGSSSGIELVPGAGVVMAVNHWPLAVETHQTNLPWADHDVANVSRVDPRRYQRTDLAWFSPECTHWSMARGEKCDYDREYEQPALLGMEDDDPESPADKEAKWRSRMLMIDVVRFAARHKYRGVIVENVPDILKWVNLDRWLADMAKLGYRHKVLTLNSAFAQGLGEPAPQLRDRVYVVFWLKKYRTPDWDKWLRPQGWCPSCGDAVRAVYSPKPGPRRPMRYGSQYVYRCPRADCRGAQVQPFVLPAAAAIDFGLPTQRIGDRKTPLAPATRARVEAGIRKHWGQSLVQTAGHTFERRPGVRTRSLDRPLPTQSTTAEQSLATSPAMLVPTGGTWNDDATPAGQPMRTRTTRENEAIVMAPFLTVLRSGRARTIELYDPLATVVADGSNHALVVPLESRDGQVARTAAEPLRTQTGRHQDALVVPLRRHGVAAPAGQHPLVTLAAGGTHHALLMRNNTARGDQAQMSYPASEPYRTMLAEQVQSLIEHPALVMRNNEGGAEMSTPVAEPLRTFTTAGHQSLIEAHGIYAYDSGHLRPLSAPMTTQTTVEGDALVGGGVFVDVDDCTLRMLAVREIQAGMAFAATFVLLGKAQRNKVRMLGNAVTPPSARDLAACLMEAITGDDIAPVEWF